MAFQCSHKKAGSGLILLFVVAAFTPDEVVVGRITKPALRKVRALNSPVLKGCGSKFCTAFLRCRAGMGPGMKSQCFSPDLAPNHARSAPLPAVWHGYPAPSRCNMAGRGADAGSDGPDHWRDRSRCSFFAPYPPYSRLFR